MPSRNVQKVYVSGQYYHVYNRGVNKQTIFREEADYTVFLNLLRRYLSRLGTKDRYGRVFPSLHGRLELLAFCLMPNHFHLCFYLKDEKAIEVLMRGVGTAYTGYFNKKYQRVGTLFQGVYKASRISSEAYLLHITRYIHLNPREYRFFEFSSLSYYLGEAEADWIEPARVLAMFQGREDYLKFVGDYEASKGVLDELKYELANGNE